MNAPKEGIGTQRIKWIHRDLRQEPAEAQKASFGLGVALVCRVVCPPGVYASLFWMNSKWIKPLKPKRVWMRPSRPLGGVTPFTWPKRVKPANELYRPGSGVHS